MDNGTASFVDLARLIHGDSSGWMCIGGSNHTKDVNGKTDWCQRWFAYPDQLDQAAAYAQTLPEGSRSTFSPAVLFTRQERSKDAVTPMVRNIICDLDTCDPRLLLIEPSVLLKTSIGRYQGVWTLEQAIPKDMAQDVNRRIAYYHRDQGADTCHDPGHMLRLTLTPNYKYQPAADVRVVKLSDAPLRLSDFSVYPEVSSPSTTVKAGGATSELPDMIPAENPLPAWVSGILAEDWSNDKSGESWRLVRRGMSLGYPYGLLRSYIRISGLFQEKYAGREADEELRIFERARYGTKNHGGHDHPDQDCWVANCPNPDGVEPPYVYSNTQTTFTTKPTEPRRYTLTRASSFKPRRVKWGWSDRMPVGELTLIPGREGIGKSLFLAWMAAHLTNGTLPGEFYGTKKAVLYAASEDSWSYTIGPRLIAAGADLDMVYRVEVEDHGKLILPTDISMIPEMVKEADAASLMLDPAISLIDDALSVNQSRDLRKALEPLRHAAEEAGIFIPALMHFNKANETDILSKIPGARAWAEVARAGFGLAEDKDAGHYVASQIKNNLGRMDLPNLTYAVDEAIVETEDGPASVGRFRWTGETEVGAEEVLSRKPERKTAETDELNSAVASKRIVALVRESGKLMTIEEVAEILDDIKPSTVQRTLKRAADSGKLINPARGLYGHPDIDTLSP